MIRAILCTMISAAALVAPAAYASQARQSPGIGAAPAGNTQLTKDDREFMDEAAQGGLLEVKLGQLVAKHGASDDVKRFAQKMVDDHTKVNQQLTDLAHQQGVTLPQELDKKHQEKLDKFSQLTGDKLDQEYMSDMIAEHKDDVKAFEKVAKDSKDLALKQLAAGTLPTLNEHLTQARQIYDRIKK